MSYKARFGFKFPRWPSRSSRGLAFLLRRDGHSGPQHSLWVSSGQHVQSICCRPECTMNYGEPHINSNKRRNQAVVEKTRPWGYFPGALPSSSETGSQLEPEKVWTVLLSQQGTNSGHSITDPAVRCAGSRLPCLPGWPECLSPRQSCLPGAGWEQAGVGDAVHGQAPASAGASVCTKSSGFNPVKS